MGYELRTNSIEPRRDTYHPLVERFGDKPATRYQEGTHNVQPTANFHYLAATDPDYDTDTLVDWLLDDEPIEPGDNESIAAIGVPHKGLLKLRVS